MIIDNNPLAIFKAMRDKDKHGNDLWIWVTDSQKEQFFFLFNRYYSKKFPQRSQLLNDKLTDKVSGMELIRHTLKDGPYPGWIWSKSEKKEKTDEYTDKEINLLMSSYNIKFEELMFLINFYPQTVKEELKYLKEANK
jgi:hypothetical protein